MPATLPKHVLLLRAWAAASLLLTLTGGPGCSSKTRDSALPGDSDTDEDTARDDTSDDTGEDRDWPEAWSNADEASALFALDLVHELALELDPAAIDALRKDPDTYVEGALSLDGLLLDPVGIRLKSRSGSFRDLDGKASFKVDFNRFDGDLRLLGLKKLNLNSLVADCSFLRPLLGARAILGAGIPTSRVGFASITLNEEPYGLYALVEELDDRFLRLHWDEPDGNLYDGDYVLLDDGFETQVDFDQETQDWFELDEGEEVGRADIHAVTDALDALERGASSWEELGGLLDAPWARRLMLVEQWIGQVDGYTVMANNYRAWFDPADDRLRLLPWDFDFAFIPAEEWELDWQAPVGRIARLCQEDSGCREEALAEIPDFIERMDSLALEEDLDLAAELIAEQVALDPRSECSVEDWQPEVERLREWVRESSEALLRDW